MSLWGDLGKGDQSAPAWVAMVLTLGIGWLAVWAVTSGHLRAWAGGLVIMGLLAAWGMGRRLGGQR